MRSQEAGIISVLARHGRARKNELGIVQNKPTRGIFNYGLTNEGKEQVVSEASKNKELLKEAVIIASPFLRTRQSARIIKKVTGNRRRIRYSWKLRERNFGTLEGQPQRRYEEVRQLDDSSPDHGKFGVEKVSSVAKRLEKLLNRAQRRHPGRTVLFVGHGDGLQILQTLIEGDTYQTYTNRTMLRQGEIREVQPKSS